MLRIQTKRRILCALSVVLVAGSTAPRGFANDLPGIGDTVPLTPLSVYTASDHFNIVMVGGDPLAFSTKTIATTIHAVVIPLVFLVNTKDNKLKLFDPTQPNSCDGGVSAVDRFKQSPLVQPAPRTFNGVSVGTFQYISAYKRAAFWKATLGSVEDTIDWYVPTQLLTTIPTFPPVISVYEGMNATINGDEASCTLRLQLPEKFINNMITENLIPSLQASGYISTGRFALFITRDVVESGSNNGTTNGAHGHTPDNFDELHPPQTFAWAEYNTTAAHISTTDFPMGDPNARGQDIFELTHEIGEWMMDPLNNNGAPSWLNPEPNACSTKFEVGDPLHGTNNAKTILWNGYYYHPTELAYFSWFYDNGTGSIAAGGAYSTYGTKTTTHPSCP